MAEKDKLILEFDKQRRWMDEGIDLDNRIIEVNDIDECMYDKIRAFRHMERISDDPVTVVVSSFGGAVYSGLRLYDILTGSKCEIITKAEGYIMSMGTIIFLAGDKRYADPNATFMFHEISSVSFGNLSNIKNDVAEAERLEKICLEITAERTKKDYKWWKKATEHVDKFMDVKQATKLGIVTHD